MSNLSSYLHRTIGVTLVASSCLACASSPDFTRSLGVMPLRPQPPVWLGPVRSLGSTPVAGAAALTQSQVPGWAHVLISVGDISTGGVYAWSLRSGSCGAQGGIIGPSDRYGEFSIRPDGSGAADALVPLTLSTSQTYAVVTNPVGPSSASAGACADLVYSPL